MTTRPKSDKPPAWFQSGPYDRVTVDRDVVSLDGRLRVAKGATGTIVSRDRGLVGVLFEDDGHFVELTGCGQRLQDVPFIDTTPAGGHAKTTD